MEEKDHEGLVVTQVCSLNRHTRLTEKGDCGAVWPNEEISIKEEPINAEIMENLAVKRIGRKEGTELHSSSYIKEEPGGTDEMDVGSETDFMSIIYMKEEPTLKEEPLDERDMELDFHNSLASRGQKSYAGVDPYSSYKALHFPYRVKTEYGSHTDISSGEHLTLQQKNRRFQCNVSSASSSSMSTVRFSSSLYPSNQAARSGGRGNEDEEETGGLEADLEPLSDTGESEIINHEPGRVEETRTYELGRVRRQPKKLVIKRKRPHKDIRVNESVFHKSIFSEPSDECTTFGELVALKLRKLDDRSCAIAQCNINSILFKAEMGKYNSFSPQQATYYHGRAGFSSSLLCESYPYQSSSQHLAISSHSVSVPYNGFNSHD